MEETTEQQQPQQTMDPRLLLRALNSLFGGRRQRRAAYRRYLKLHGVPKPIFARISERRSFDLANMLTFLEDVRKAVGPKEPPKPEGQAL